MLPDIFGDRHGIPSLSTGPGVFSTPCGRTVAWHLRTYIPASIILEHFSTAWVWEREKIGVSILLKFYTKMDTFKLCRMKVHVALREQKNFHQRTTAPPLIALWISSMEGFRQTSAIKHHAHMFHKHLRDRTWTYRACK